MSTRKTEATRIAERVAAEEPVLVVVAGPNGAGKTTFVETFLAMLALRVVNADAIARALSLLLRKQLRTKRRGSPTT